MRICVFGAGAVGGLLAARIARSGQLVAVVARGATKEAIEQQGIAVRDRDGAWVAKPAQVVASAAELGPQDLVFVATKAHALPAAARELAPLIADTTTVVTAVNGIPWWYFHRTAFEPPHLACVDPGGVVWSAIGPQRTLGCVVHLGASVERPGVVHHAYGNVFVLGDPETPSSPRLDAAAGVLSRAGFRPQVSAEIRDEVWRKLWYNLAINPVSVITASACDRICADPVLRQLMSQMIRESARIAEALGVTATVDPDEQVRGIARIGAFRTSMLQDLEAGRSIELDPVLGSLVELAGRLQIEAPRLAEIHALARTRAAATGCYRPLAEHPHGGSA